MDLFVLKYLLLGLLIFMPIVTLIHELGHAFFAKIFGANINKIVIGRGKPILTLKKFEIRHIYFGTSYFEADKLKNSKLSKILTLSGGILFNIISCLIIVILCSLKVISYTESMSIFILFTLNMTLFNMIPIKIGNYLSDGLQIFMLITKSQ